MSCYQCVFHQTEANLATIQLQNHQNVKKIQFWQKVPGVNGSIVTQFSKNGSFFATFEKTMPTPTKLENARPRLFKERCSFLLFFRNDIWI